MVMARVYKILWLWVFHIYMYIYIYICIYIYIFTMKSAQIHFVIYCVLIRPATTYFPHIIQDYTVAGQLRQMSPISFRITSLVLGQSCDCPNTSDVTLKIRRKCWQEFTSNPRYNPAKKSTINCLCYMICTVISMGECKKDVTPVFLH